MHFGGNIKILAKGLALKVGYLGLNYRLPSKGGVRREEGAGWWGAGKDGIRKGKEEEKEEGRKETKGRKGGRKRGDKEQFSHHECTWMPGIAILLNPFHLRSCLTHLRMKMSHAG